MSTLRELTAAHPSVGRVQAIILRPGREIEPTSVQEVLAVPGVGLEGDRYGQRTRNANTKHTREITLIQAEHLPVVAGITGHHAIEPALLRRNLVVSGINLLAMRSPFPDVTFQWCIGDEVVIEVTGPCDPCSRMEAALGEGGYNAMRGHGGVTARIVVGGRLRVGDLVRIGDSATA